MPSPSAFSDRRVVIAIATLCCFLWGSAVPAVKVGYAMIGIAPADTGSLLLFAGVRFFIAGVMLLAYCALTGKRIAITMPTLGAFGLLGLISTAGQYLFFYIGLAHTTGVKVSITTSTSTFFAVLLAHFIYTNDRLTPRRAVGCLVGFAGVVAVNLSGAGLDLNLSFLGEGFIVIAAMMFVVAGIYAKRLSRNIEVAVMTGWQLMLGGAMLAGLGLSVGGHLENFSPSSVLLLGYLAALSAAAFALWNLLLKHNPIGMVSIFTCLIPIFGVLLSGLILGESVLEWKNLAALMLVCFGIWMVTTARARLLPVTP